MFGGCPYFGVDIDGKEEELEAYQRGENGNIISEFISTLQSYTEISQSGKGIHIICRGKLPKRGRRKGSVEMYEDGRFFVMTGNSCSEYEGIAECSDSIKPLHEKYIGGGHEPVAKAVPAVRLDTADQIIKAAAGAKNGGKFVSLYSGRTAGYTSQSEADTALSLRTFTKRPLSAKYSHRHLSRHSLYDIQYNHYITINMNCQQQ
jgi:putative DNA primase/helicase